MIPFLLALALQYPAAGQAPPAGQYDAAPAPRAERGDRQARRYPGVSDAGNAILQQALTAPDQALAGLQRQQRGIHDALVAAASASPVDVDQVSTLLKQRRDAQAQFRERQDERLVAVMRQLSPADRAAFMRALIAPVGPGGMMPPR